MILSVSSMILRVPFLGGGKQNYDFVATARPSLKPREPSSSQKVSPSPQQRDTVTFETACAPADGVLGSGGGAVAFRVRFGLTTRAKFVPAFAFFDLRRRRSLPWLGFTQSARGKKCKKVSVPKSICAKMNRSKTWIWRMCSANA